ncbi:MAG: hypothetical protein HRT89_01635 [Lentisphaeria bacterium]|nr:hypothetical protein [Lentisphaeria bacterium]NQZ66748.1 hypothetical protein [Lentisphaeria bacterium]
MKNIYKVMVLIAMSCLSLNAQEKETKVDPDIACATASIKAYRALKLNKELQDPVRSKWDIYHKEAEASFNDAYEILGKAVNEEQAKKKEEIDKEFIKEANERKAKMYRKWHTEFVKKEYIIWQSERTEIIKKYTALNYYFEYLKNMKHTPKKQIWI